MNARLVRVASAPSAPVADTGSLPPGSAPPNADYGGMIRLGLWILIAGFGGFLAWALLAPLDEGIPASGVIAVESNRKRVDHASGGVVEQILVREGQRVKAGEALVVLDATQARAGLDATLAQFRTAQAVLARLQAEREGAAAVAVAFPADLLAAAERPEAAAAMRAQTDLFQSRRSALQGELRIIRESVLGLELQLASLSQLRAGREKQIALFEEQLQSYERLKRQGFLSRNHLLEVERQLAEVQSKQSEDLSNIAGINARLAEFRMRGAQREIEYRREVEAQLAEVQRELATLGERLTAQRDTVERLDVRAPAGGTVVDLAVHTIGGVVKAGDRILDILPADDDLIVEARAAPQYVDRLRPGQPADVRVEAYVDRAEPPLVTGLVEVVSADALADARTGHAYYAVRVTVPRAELAKLGKLELVPGMPATVMVKTGERTLATYLLRPLLHRFATAMSE